MKISKFAIFSVTLLIAFTIYYLTQANYEFLIYTTTLFGLICVIEITDRWLGYTKLAKIGFCAWLTLHMLGGCLYINGTRLYDSILINILGEPFHILKYDQLIHTICYFVMTLMIFPVVLKIAKKNANIYSVCLIVALASMGLSAMNEVVEFSAVAFFNSKGVGNYYNNALDLVFNLLGILIATIYNLRTKSIRPESLPANTGA